MPIAMPLNSIKAEVKAEIIEEESPIKAIHHHNQIFKTLMSALGTSKPECSTIVEQPCNPAAPPIQSLMSSNYAPPSPLPQLSTSKKLRTPSALRNSGDRRTKIEDIDSHCRRTEGKDPKRIRTAPKFMGLY
uniref:Uncharacterized protein n=1 Tax=Ditylenchus dipsaci TaxID=166011 RepID=A0A915DGR5_9BILA